MTELFWINPFIALFIGILISFLFRKINARIQSRRGPVIRVPPAWRDINRTKIFQPLYDILKLFSKDTFIPEKASSLFIIGPVMALVCAVLATLFVPIAGISFDYSYGLVVLIYLLMGEILCVIVGGITSGSLFAVIGGVREIELMLTNEIPFILGTFALAISYDSLSVNDMMGFNLITNPFAAIVVFLSILVKLHIKPFDISDAESEIVSGLTTEYSGKLLGIIEITKQMMAFVLIALFADLFLWVPSSGVGAWVVFLVGVGFTSVMIAMVHSLFGRFRIDQATWWMLRVPLVLSVIAVFWAAAWRYVL
ncbi:MAG TPA: complex I subunit 1 family protein [Methanospirillum sp.]|uniref:respiratory chain complex I subunit 1 family protein n=1 Tax=Methanospirillum sp. TaxID=45200 RepID=UPI002CACDB87|nr:complex I subunit 1 family protein [Methanospirillum sp.]HWQ64530.1 complex I subunit 1 family protein [Methanospirillum sp.]